MTIKSVEEKTSEIQCYALAWLEEKEARKKIEAAMAAKNRHSATVRSELNAIPGKAIYCRVNNTDNVVVMYMSAENQIVVVDARPNTFPKGGTN